MLKLRKAILIKNNTNIVQPKRGRNTIFLAMIELPMSIINKAGIKAIRNANTAVHVGNDWRMVSNGRLMEETGPSHQEGKEDTENRPIRIPKAKIRDRIKASPVKLMMI